MTTKYSNPNGMDYKMEYEPKNIPSNYSDYLRIILNKIKTEFEQLSNQI